MKFPGGMNLQQMMKQAQAMKSKIGGMLPPGLM